nr:phage integrase N-terminal SAM-like domain-containing protein [Stutzerimonas stutzeri]
MDGKPRLLDRLREQIRVRHYSIRTESAYVQWARAFIRFHKLRHPAEMGAVEVEQFLTHLAVERNVSASIQNQALAALLFLLQAGARYPVALAGWCRAGQAVGALAGGAVA